MGWEIIKYGYFDRIDFYNLPPSTLALLQLNGVYSNQIRWHKPDPESRISADIIISLFSCGFHYPITMYAPLVRKSLKPGGIAVFDVRRKENAELSGFVELGRLENHEKSQRVIYTRSDVGK